MTQGSLRVAGHEFICAILASPAILAILWKTGFAYQLHSYLLVISINSLPKSSYKSLVLWSVTSEWCNIRGKAFCVYGVLNSGWHSDISKVVIY